MDLSKKSFQTYQNFSEEGNMVMNDIRNFQQKKKSKKRQYKGERYKNLSEDEK